MGLAERHALTHEPIGEVRREGEARGREFRHTLRLEPERPHHPGEGGKQHPEGVDGVENRFLVFLQVAVVREGQPLERSRTPPSPT